MWFESKRLFRQMFVALGFPGNGTVLQSANAQSDAGTGSRGSVSRTRLVSVAFVLSRLTGSYVLVPAVYGESLRTSERRASFSTYSVRTWPVIGEPSAFFATGTSMLMRPFVRRMSDCQPL